MKIKYSLKNIRKFVLIRNPWNFMHTVFINDKPLHFIDTYDKQELEISKRGLLYSEKDKSIEEIILELENTKESPEVFYLSENPDASWKIFISHCTLIEAAGGLVQNKSGEYLVIFRLDKWDLPKGKIEYDESPEQAAIREVQEECGIDELVIVQKIPLTFHTYTLKKKRMLKKTNWYLMQTKYSSPLVPQKEESIEEARWMNKKEIEKKVLANTYASIADLLKIFFSRA